MQWILLILAFIIPLIASLNVKSTFKKYSKVRSERGLTGAEAARQLLDRTGKRLAPGQKVRFLYTVGKEDVHAWELPDPIPPEAVDKAKYRLLFGRAAATILYPFGIDAKEVEDWACGGLQFKLI